MQASSGPSTTGLGGVPVEAPPRQHSQLEQPQHPQYPASDMPSATSTAWAPKTTPSNSGAPSLGGSILNSIQPQSFASAHSGANDILPAASPPAAQQHTLGNSHSTFGHSPMVIPSPNQQACSLSMTGQTLVSSSVCWATTPLARQSRSAGKLCLS